MQDRVQREIQYLGLLQHPHIIKLYETFEPSRAWMETLICVCISYEVLQTQESIVMVIEYLSGELFEYIVNTGRVRVLDPARGRLATYSLR
jgi:carbon catabolite-derepressing protein kinase